MTRPTRMPNLGQPVLASTRNDGNPAWRSCGVEGFFAKLTRRRLKHGVFHSLVDLQHAVDTVVDIHNQ
jgi:hypothetical protein